MAKRNRIGNWNNRKVLDGPQDAGGTTSKGIRGIYQVDNATDESGLATVRTRRILGGLLTKEERAERAAKDEKFTRVWKTKSDPLKSRTTEFRDDGSGTVTTVSKRGNGTGIDEVNADGRLVQRQQSFATHDVTITPRQDGGYVKEVARGGEVQRKQYGPTGKVESKAVYRGAEDGAPALLRTIESNRFSLDDDDPPVLAGGAPTGASAEPGRSGLHRLTSGSSRSSTSPARIASAADEAHHFGAPSTGTGAIRRLQDVVRSSPSAQVSVASSGYAASLASAASSSVRSDSQGSTISRSSTLSSTPTELSTARAAPVRRSSSSLRGLADRGKRDRSDNANQL